MPALAPEGSNDRLFSGGEISETWSGDGRDAGSLHYCANGGHSGDHYPARTEAVVASAHHRYPAPSSMRPSKRRASLGDGRCGALGRPFACTSRQSQSANPAEFVEVRKPMPFAVVNGALVNLQRTEKVTAGPLVQRGGRGRLVRKFRLV